MKSKLYYWMFCNIIQHCTIEKCLALLTFVLFVVFNWTSCRHAQISRNIFSFHILSCRIWTLGPIWTFSLRGVLTFVASVLDINGCVLSYFEGTENVHCYTSYTRTTLLHYFSRVIFILLSSVSIVWFLSVSHSFGVLLLSGMLPCVIWPSLSRWHPCSPAPSAGPLHSWQVWICEGDPGPFLPDLAALGWGGTNGVRRSSSQTGWSWSELGLNLASSHAK